jgi:hypothetical protein
MVAPSHTGHEKPHDDVLKKASRNSSRYQRMLTLVPGGDFSHAESRFSLGPEARLPVASPTAGVFRA